MPARLSAVLQHPGSNVVPLLTRFQLRSAARLSVRFHRLGRQRSLDANEQRCLQFRSTALCPLSARTSRGSGHRRNLRASVTASYDTPTAENVAIVRFNIPYEAGFGNYLKVVGSHESLGNWHLPSAPVMEWREGHVWTAAVHIAEGVGVEYKFAVVTPQGDVWELCDNRLLEVPELSDDSSAIITASCLWNNVEGTEYMIEGVEEDSTEEVFDGVAVEGEAAVDGVEQVEEEEEEELEDDGSWIPVADQAPEDGLVGVTVVVEYEADLGCYLKIVGSDENIGEWELESAPVMEWQEGHRWVSTFRVAEGSTLEYKFVLLAPNGHCWEGCSNRVVSVLPPEGFECSLAEMTVLCGWNSEDVVMKYVAAPFVEPPPEATPLDSLDEVTLALDSALHYDSTVSDLLIEELMKSQELDDTVNSLSDTESDTDESDFDEFYTIDDLDERSEAVQQYTGNGGDPEEEEEEEEEETVDEDLGDLNDDSLGVDQSNGDGWSARLGSSSDDDVSADEELQEAEGTVATLSTPEETQTRGLEEPKDWRRFTDSSLYTRAGNGVPSAGYQVHLEAPLFDYLEARSDEAVDEQHQDFWNAAPENLLSPEDGCAGPGDDSASAAASDSAAEEPEDVEQEQDVVEEDAAVANLEQEDEAAVSLEEEDVPVASLEEEDETAVSLYEEDETAVSLDEDEDDDDAVLESAVNEVVTGVEQLEAALHAMESAVASFQADSQQRIEQPENGAAPLEEEGEDTAGSFLASAMGLKRENGTSAPRSTIPQNGDAGYSGAGRWGPGGEYTPGGYDDIWAQYKQMSQKSSTGDSNGTPPSASTTTQEHRSFNPVASTTAAETASESQLTEAAVAAASLADADTETQTLDFAMAGELKSHALDDDDDDAEDDEAALEAAAIDLNAGKLDMETQETHVIDMETQDTQLISTIPTEVIETTISTGDMETTKIAQEAEVAAMKLTDELATGELDLKGVTLAEETAAQEAEPASLLVSSMLTLHVVDSADGEIAADGDAKEETPRPEDVVHSGEAEEQDIGIQEIVLEDGRAFVEEQADGSFVYRFELEVAAEALPSAQQALQHGQHGSDDQVDATSRVDTSLASIARTLKSLNDSLELVDKSLALVDQQYSGLGSSSEEEEEENGPLVSTANSNGVETSVVNGNGSLHAADHVTLKNGESKNGELKNGDLKNGASKNGELKNGELFVAQLPEDGSVEVTSGGNGVSPGPPHVQHSALYTNFNQQ